MYEYTVLSKDAFCKIIESAKEYIVPEKKFDSLWEITIIPSYMHNSDTAFLFNSNNEWIMILANGNDKKNIIDMIQIKKVKDIIKEFV